MISANRIVIRVREDFIDGDYVTWASACRRCRQHFRRASTSPALGERPSLDRPQFPTDAESIPNLINAGM